MRCLKREDYDKSMPEDNKFNSISQVLPHKHTIRSDYEKQMFESYKFRTKEKKTEIELVDFIKNKVIYF